MRGVMLDSRVLERQADPVPTLGQHSREILQGELGLTDDEFERLEAEGLVGNGPSFVSVVRRGSDQRELSTGGFAFLSRPCGKDADRLDRVDPRE